MTAPNGWVQPQSRSFAFLVQISTFTSHRRNPSYCYLCAGPPFFSPRLQPCQCSCKLRDKLLQAFLLADAGGGFPTLAWLRLSRPRRARHPSRAAALRRPGVVFGRPRPLSSVIAPPDSGPSPSLSDLRRPVPDVVFFRPRACFNA